MHPNNLHHWKGRRFATIMGDCFVYSQQQLILMAEDRLIGLPKLGLLQSWGGNMLP